MGQAGCRLCQQKTVKLVKIFEYKTMDVPYLIKKFLNIKIFREDPFDDICNSCIYVLANFNDFYKMCHKSNKFIQTNLKLKMQIRTHNDNNAHHDYKNKTANLRNREESGKDHTLQNIDNNYTLDKDISENTGNSFEYKEEKQEELSRNSKLHVLKIEDTTGTNIYTCDICQKQFSTFFDYQDHQETHDGDDVFKCNKCEKIFNKRKLLVEHETRHKVPCTICKVEVLPKSMSAHLLLHTDIHKCLHCGMRHTSKASLEKHTKAKHAGQKGFVCHVCGKQSSCHSSMNRHMAYHSADRPYRCNFCDFSAKSSNILQVHTSRRHLGEKCVCEVCEKVFKSRLSLQQHTKRMHTSRKHRCEICGKDFMENYNLKRHLKKHVGQTVRECKICGKEFFAVRELKEHMHSHREGCVSCPKCEKMFFYKKYFNKHVVKCETNKI